MNIHIRVRRPRHMVALPPLLIEEVVDDACTEIRVDVTLPAAPVRTPIPLVATVPRGAADDDKTTIIRKRPRPDLIIPDHDDMAPPPPRTRSIHEALQGRLWTKERIAALRARIVPNCNARNAHPMDCRVTTDFGEYTDEHGIKQRRHDYYCDGVKCTRANGWISGSGFNKVLFKPFDAEFMAKKCAATKDPTSEYFGKTVEQIRTDWDNNRDSGTAKHAAYDAFMQGQEEVPDDAEPPPPGFYRAMEEVLTVHRLWPYRTEWSIADPVHKVTAQPDAVFVDEDGVLHLGDWKNCKPADLRNEEDVSDYGTHPFTHTMKDSKLSHYKIQLSIYWYLLTAVYGLRVSRTIWLFNFRPADPEGYQIIKFEPLDMAPLWALLPWRDDDPRHGQFDGPTLLAERFADDDPRALNGPTVRVRAPKVMQNNDAVVWTGNTYIKGDYRLEATGWTHSWRWFGAPPRGAAGYYEYKLLQDQDALCRIPTLVGKQIACWCSKPEWRCHADVLVKYANLYAAGAFALPRGTGMGRFDETFTPDLLQ